MEYVDPSYNSTIGQEPTPPKVEDLNTTKLKQGPRKRVSQACDRCRSRKDKCDGKKPACSTCTTHGRICSYDTNVKKRGLPEGYVRGLEKLWGLAIREVTGVEDDVLLVITGEIGGDAFFSDWNDEGNSDNLVEIWRRSKISKELERLLSNTDHPLENRKRKHTDSNAQAERRAWMLVKDTSPKDPTEPAQSSWIAKESDIYPKDSPLEPANIPETYDSRNISLGGDESILTPSYQHGYSSKRRAVSIESLELPSEAWHLINVYSSYTHPWLPIIERQDLLRSTYQYLRKPSDFSITGTGSGNHAVLWAVIAYAKYQHRAINNIPHAQGPVADVVWTAERMYDQARSLIPDEEGSFELGHIQALLVLALANMGNGHLSRAWLLIGQAVRIAIDMGLGRPSDDPLMALKSPSRTKHVFLGCFILDTIIASRLGYHPHLRVEDVEQVGPVEEEGLDEWDPWSDCLTVCRTSPASRPASILSTFNRFVKLMQLLNEASCERDSPRRIQSSKGLLEKLYAWSQAQPSPLNFESTSAASRQDPLAPLPHHYNLEIAHYNTLATLQLMSHSQDKDGAIEELGARSARQIAELLIQHSSNFGLLIVPPTFEYFVKTAYDVIRDLQSTMEETNISLVNWKHSLDIYVDMMEPAWPIFESFKNSISFQTPSAGRRESQVAFELISGTNQLAVTPPAVRTPSSLESGHAPNGRVPRYQPVQAIGSVAQHERAMVSPNLNQTRTFSLSTSDQLLTNNYPGAQQFNADNSIATDSQNANDRVSQVNYRSNLETSSDPLRQRGSISVEMKLDPMFQEFATLDATEWYLNYFLYCLRLLTYFQGR